jgi:hypothetical protein
VEAWVYSSESRSLFIDGVPVSTCESPGMRALMQTYKTLHRRCGRGMDGKGEVAGGQSRELGARCALELSAGVHNTHKHAREREKVDGWFYAYMYTQGCVSYRYAHARV